MAEEFVEKYIEKNPKLSGYIFISYIIFYIFIITYYLFTQYFFYTSIIGLIYIPIIWLLLKYSKTNIIKFSYILIPIAIFLSYNFYNILSYFLLYNIFLFIIFYFLGNFIGESRISINKRSLIFYIILIIYLISIYILKYYNLFSLSIILFLIFIINYFDDNKKISINFLNKINNYKDIIFIILSILPLIQVLMSLYCYNIFYISIVSIFSIIEFIIINMIKKIFDKKFEGFTMYFLIIFIFLFLFSTQIFFVTNNIILYYLQTIFLSIVFYFTAIHAYLYHRFPDNKKIILGIISGIPLIIINFINFIVYYLSPNIYLRIILFTINILIIGVINLVLISIHIIYKNPT